MEKTKILPGLLVFFLGFVSCVTTGNMGSIEVEMMKPALVPFSKDIDTIAIFRRHLYNAEPPTFKNLERQYLSQYFDTATNLENLHRILSNKCVDALACYLENEGYFLKVINYRDSMNHLFKKNDYAVNRINNYADNYPELVKNLKVDACIFLDYFEMNDYLIKNTPDSHAVYRLPEFEIDTDLEHITVNLFWTVAIKGDMASYGIKQPEDLYYLNLMNPEFFGNQINHQKMLENTSTYLGNSFGAKLFPFMHQVDRSYYSSHNTKMQIAEKHLLAGDWLSAAEIYNQETKNKNRNISAKATFNMALVCELEGKIDAAIDWIAISHSVYNQKNLEHELNCRDYVTLLSIRKKELEKLEEQVR